MSSIGNYKHAIEENIRIKAEKLIELFSPFVDYGSDDILTEKEVMRKNAINCAVSHCYLIIRELNEIEKSESGVINDCLGQDDYKLMIKYFINV